MAVLRQMRHEPDGECEEFHCHSHGVDETGRGYLVCGECGHTFPTWRDLLRDYNANARNEGTPGARTVDAVDFCPHCTTDF